MPKFLILYNSELSAGELMANASPDQMQASMQEWSQWREAASATFKFDFGLPLQVDGRITNEGITESDCEVTGYSMAEGDSKEALMELLKSHPHLKRPAASIDVLEMLSMPGLDASAQSQQPQAA